MYLCYIHQISTNIKTFCTTAYACHTFILMIIIYDYIELGFFLHDNLVYIWTSPPNILTYDMLFLHQISTEICRGKLVDILHKTDVSTSMQDIYVEYLCHAH